MNVPSEVIEMITGMYLNWPNSDYVNDIEAGQLTYMLTIDEGMPIVMGGKEAKGRTLQLIQEEFGIVKADGFKQLLTPFSLEHMRRGYNGFKQDAHAIFKHNGGFIHARMRCGECNVSLNALILVSRGAHKSTHGHSRPGCDDREKLRIDRIINNPQTFYPLPK